MDLTNTILDGRYRLTRLMGEGGMGQVYEGVHLQLGLKIAVKVLLPRYAYDSKFRERFLREARATSKVRHPNIVQILDFGQTPNGSVYFAMEYLQGRDLASLLREEGYLPWPRARHLLLQMVSALGAAHEHKIIHRDVKPGNFFIINAFGHQEFIKVLDFGIAKITAGPNGEDQTLAKSLTGTGEIFGTAKYMAPEQAFGDSGDLRVDVYSLGIVAYQMLTSVVPFDGESTFEIITRHVNDAPQAPRELNPTIPAAVEAVILEALAKRPDDRFSSMDQIRRALMAIPAEVAVPTPSRGPVRWGAPSSTASPPPKPAREEHAPSARVRHEDTDPLELEGYPQLKSRGSPIDLPVALNPFKSIERDDDSQESVNPFRSVLDPRREEEPAWSEPSAAGGEPRPVWDTPTSALGEPQPGWDTPTSALGTPGPVWDTPTSALSSARDSDRDRSAPDEGERGAEPPAPGSAVMVDPSLDPSLPAELRAAGPVFTSDEMAAFETLRQMTKPPGLQRSAPPGGASPSPSAAVPAPSQPPDASATSAIDRAIHAELQRQAVDPPNGPSSMALSDRAVPLEPSRRMVSGATPMVRRVRAPPPPPPPRPDPARAASTAGVKPSARVGPAPKRPRGITPAPTADASSSALDDASPRRSPRDPDAPSVVPERESSPSAGALGSEGVEGVEAAAVPASSRRLIVGLLIALVFAAGAVVVAWVARSRATPSSAVDGSP